MSDNFEGIGQASLADFEDVESELLSPQFAGENLTGELTESGDDLERYDQYEVDADFEV